ncbi:MAG: hypothetical protein HY788_17020 [Deltaproteobacteria bacterium]|nr:hypothetical protein [Deltaproteobacteria bacterium]
MITKAGRIPTVITAVLMFLITAVSANAALELYTVQHAIEQRQLQWTAEDSLLSLLSSGEKVGYAGLSLPTPEDQAQADLWMPEAYASLPSTFDWRNVEGASWIGPVQDQMGSPVSYALAGVQNLEDLLRIRENESDLNLNLTAYPLIPEDPADGSFTAFQNVLKRFGAPVDASDVNENYTIRSWQWVILDEPDVEAIKQAVLRGPVLTLMDVYEDFLYYQSGVYQALAMNFLGAHVVRIMGWDDSARAWIVQNSWGESWGENGYARIHWDDPFSQIGRFTVIQQVDPISGAVQATDNTSDSASTGSGVTGSSTKQIHPMTGGIADSSPVYRALDETPLILQSTTVTLAWDACANATWYRWEVNTSSVWNEGGRVFYGNIGTATSRVLNQLEAGVVYYWRVWAGNDAGESAPAVGPAFTLQTVSTTYAINASAGAHGSITPTGATTIPQGSAQTYAITPASGYQVSSVLVDGVSIGNVTTYTFQNVQANHTITVSFKTAGPDYDINNDGFVDVTDIMIVASNWDKTINDAGFNPAADLNGDNRVDIADVMMIVSMWRHKV